MKKSLKYIEVFDKSVERLAEKKDHEKKISIELINGLADYEKNIMITYADDNNVSLIFNNPSYTELPEKLYKLKYEKQTNSGLIFYLKKEKNSDYWDSLEKRRDYSEI